LPDDWPTVLAGVLGARVSFQPMRVLAKKIISEARAFSSVMALVSSGGA
jgi:hypothetical protein